MVSLPGLPFLHAGVPAGLVAHKARDSLDLLPELVKRLWPVIVKFAGKTIKDQMHKQAVYGSDSEVDRAMGLLTRTPMPIPVTKSWVNEVIAVFWPLISSAMEQILKEKVLPELRAKLPSFLHSINVEPCTLGKIPPRVKELAVLPRGHSDAFLDLVVDVEYIGDADIKFVFHGASLGVREVKFEARLFLSLHELLEEPPFLEGASVHMASPCRLSMDWTGVVDFLDHGFFEDLIHKVVNDQLKSVLVLPARLPVPLDSAHRMRVFDMVRPRPRGCLQVTVLEASGLVGNEYELKAILTGELTTDPMVEISIGGMRWRSPSVQNTTEPRWEEDNTHFFLVDVPGEQKMDVHVWDDDLTTKMRLKVTDSPADEVARRCGLCLTQLLGRAVGDELREEIISEQRIPLESWWPGRGLGPDAEEFAGAPVQSGSQGASGEHDGREKGLLERALAAGEGLLNRAAAGGEKGGDEKGLLQRALVAGEGVLHRTVTWAQDKLRKRREKLGQEATERLKNAEASLRVRLHWRPLRAGQARPLGGLVAVPPGDGCAAGRPPGPAAWAPPWRPGAPSAGPQAVDDGWPAYVLLLGVAAAQRVPCSEDQAFFVKCDVTPVLTEEGTLVAESTEGVTTRTTKQRRPIAGSVSGLASSDDESKLLARKIGLMLNARMPVQDIADVLDLDQGVVLRLLGRALSEKSECRDVAFDEAFVFLLRDPAPARVGLELFSQGAKGKPTSLGTASLGVGALLYRDGMTEDIEGLPLSDTVSPARLSLRATLWPVDRGAGLAQRPPPPLARTTLPADRGGPLAAGAAGVGRRVAVWVYGARGLKNVDMFGGKSDPYCICMLAEAKQAKKLFQTKVVDNDPDPDWNHGPEEVNLGSGRAELLFEIYDKDFCRKGDKLGVATVSMEQCLHGLYTDMDLGDGVGTLRVKISPVGPSGAPADVRWTPPQVRPRLQVWVDRAEGLRSADAFGGKSDPFVICSLSEKKVFRTQVIQDDNDPVWDHGPEELVLGSEQELRFEVRDRDVIGSDFLGKAALPRAQCVSGFDGRLDLGAGCGILHVRVALARSGQEPPPARLEVTILGAKALRSGSWFMGSSDPYAVCKLRGKPLFQTKAISSELNPSWDHGPVEVAMGHSERELRFEVYDRNTLGRDTLLGRGSVMREACLAGFEGDVDLGSGSGSLRLRVVPVGAGPASAAAAAALQAQATTAVSLSPGTTAATDPTSNPAGLDSPETVDARTRTVVWVYGARGLRNADMFGGKSDPYCICKLVEDQLSQKAFQTRVIDNDPNPQWDHGPEEVAWAGHKELVFEVYDKDMLRTGDKLGEARLSRKQCMQGLHEDLPLGEGNGTLSVKIAPMTLQTQPAASGQAPELVVSDVPSRGETGDVSVAADS